MSEMSISKVFSMILTLVFVAILLPIGLQAILGMTIEGLDPALLTLLQIILPLSVIAGVVLAFLPRFRRGGE